MWGFDHTRGPCSQCGGPVVLGTTCGCGWFEEVPEADDDALVAPHAQVTADRDEFFTDDDIPS